MTQRNGKRTEKQPIMAVRRVSHWICCPRKDARGRGAGEAQSNLLNEKLRHNQNFREEEKKGGGAGNGERAVAATDCYCCRCFGR